MASTAVPVPLETCRTDIVTCACLRPGLGIKHVLQVFLPPARW